MFNIPSIQNTVYDLLRETINKLVNLTKLHFASGLKRAGHRLHSEVFFDTLKISCGVAAKDIFERAAQRQINLRVYTEGVVRTIHVLIKC